MQFKVYINYTLIHQRTFQLYLQNMQGARQDLIMGLLLDPNNDEVLSILSRLFPGKYVGDVINIRASESAKLALRNMLYPPVLNPKTTETVPR